VPGAASANDALGMNGQQVAVQPDQAQVPVQQAAPVQQQLPQPVAQAAPVQQAAPVAAPQAAAPAGIQSAPAGMPDLSGLDPNARALVERMYANQQAAQ
jgi:hypothetical protein